MNKIFYLIGVIVLIMIFSQNGNSQVVNAGVSGGLNRFSHNSDNADFYWSNSYMLMPGRLNDDRFTFTLGIVTEISPAAKSNSALQIRLAYNSYSFTSDFKVINNERTDVTGQILSNPDPVTLDTNRVFLYGNEFTLQSISLDLLYKYNLIDNLSVLAGTKLNYFYNNEIYAVQRLTLPIQVQFKRETGKVYIDNDRTMVIYKDSEIKDFSRFNLGLSLGLQYNWKFSGLEINPFVKYDMYFTELMPGKGWRLTAYNMGVDFMLAL